MKKTCLALLCGLVLAAPAHAVRPSYSYFDASYLSAEVDGSDGANGLRFALARSLNRWFYVTGGHDRLEGDNDDITQTETSLGFGLHSLKSTLQFFGAGSYERLDTYGDTGDPLAPRLDDTDEGYGLLLGARLPLGGAELQADYKYVNYGDLPDGSRFDEDRYRLSALAHLTPRFALTGSYEIFEQAKDLDQWTAGLRIYFNNRHDQPGKKRGVPATPAAPTAAEPAEASAQPETEPQ